MLRRTLIPTIFLAIACMAHGTESVPRDVSELAKNAQTCEHLAGEYDGDLPDRRKKQILRDIRLTCGAAHRQLEELRKKYRNDPAVLRIVERCATDAVTSYQ